MGWVTAKASRDDAMHVLVAASHLQSNMATQYRQMALSIGDLAQHSCEDIAAAGRAT
jgi:hypothetical protein